MIHQMFDMSIQKQMVKYSLVLIISIALVANVKSESCKFEQVVYLKITNFA